MWLNRLRNFRVGHGYSTPLFASSNFVRCIANPLNLTNMPSENSISKMTIFKLMTASGLLFLYGYLKYVTLKSVKVDSDVPLEFIYQLEDVQRLIQLENYEEANEKLKLVLELRNNINNNCTFIYYVKKSLIATSIMMGELLYKKGLYAKAHGFFVDAYNGQKQIDRPDSNETIGILLKMAKTLNKRAKYNEAQKIYINCLNNMNSHALEHEDDKTLLAYCSLKYGQFLAHLARHEAAIQQLNKTVSIIEGLSSFSAQEIIYVKSIIASVLVDAHRIDEAIALFAELLDRCQAENLQKIYIDTLLYNLVNAECLKETIT